MLCLMTYRMWTFHAGHVLVGTNANGSMEVLCTAAWDVCLDAFTLSDEQQPFDDSMPTSAELQDTCTKLEVELPDLSPH